MTARRAGLAALTLGLIAAALLHGRMAIPPVYDGIVVPPEPYRWESPPPNLAAGNKPPLPGDVTLPIQNGQVAGGGVQTGDNQVVIYFGPGAFKAPAGATGVKCTIAPDPNPPAPPAGVEIRGNVYRVGCVGQPGSGPATVVSNYHLTLRFPPGAFKEIQFNDGTGWRPLATLTAPWGDRHLSGDPAPASPDPSPPAEENLNRAFGIVLTVELFPLHAFGARYDLPAPLN